MSSAVLPPLPADLTYCVVVRRNDSLGARRRWLVFGAVALVSLALASAFAAIGAWPVLPYSVLEIAVLGVAFWWMDRHAGDWERLTVAGDCVRIERETCGRRERREFNRYWLRVEVEPAASGTASCLRLYSAGTSWEFGAALPFAERMKVTQELRRLCACR